jgi:hypothetical protein
MANFMRRWGSITLTMLFSAAALLVCQPRPDSGERFCHHQPDLGLQRRVCAPFGVSCTSATGTRLHPFSDPSKATLNTPIGFVDVDKNVNLTRAFGPKPAST